MMIKNVKMRTLIILGAFAFLGIQGCEKDTDEIIEDVTPKVTCEINGLNWETEVAGGLTSTVFAITASKDKEAVILSIPSKDVGVYPIDIISSNAVYSPIIDSLSTTYVAYSGEIEITSINTLRTQVQGTFYFSAANATTLDTISIANGILKNIPAK